jgi:hypothetical protein
MLEIYENDKDANHVAAAHIVIFGTQLERCTEHDRKTMQKDIVSSQLPPTEQQVWLTFQAPLCTGKPKE